MSKKIAIIGGGPAGYTAALRASQLDAKVVLIESGHLGGTCLNVGCIPTKSLLESSKTFKDGKIFFSESVVNNVPWNKVMGRKNQVVKELREGVRELLAAGKIEVISGIAAFNGNELEVQTFDNKKQIINADFTIIATGSEPVIPQIPGIHLDGVWTSDEFIKQNDPFPEHMAILGAGVIGIEFATLLTELGVKVSVIEASSNVIPTTDTDISKKVKEDLEKQDVTFYLDKTLEEIVKKNDSFLELRLSNNQTIEVNSLLLAVGRKPNTEKLNLLQNGIEVEKSRIKINKFYQTSRKNVYAVGDCSSSMMLAHVAMEEAKIAVEHALDHAPIPIIYEYIPQCIYIHPEVASVGITTKEAKKRGFDVQEGVFPLIANGRALVGLETSGFIKVLSEKRYGRVLGVHIYAPNATEIISEATLALNLEATVDEFLATIHPHPTVAESIPEAILSTNGEAIHLPSRR